MRKLFGFSLTILAATILCGASAQTLDIDQMSKEDLGKLTPEQMNTLPAFKVWNKLEPQMAASLGMGVDVQRLSRTVAVKAPAPAPSPTIIV